MSDRHRIGIIGVGELAGYLVEGMLRTHSSSNITLSPRNLHKSRMLAKRFGVATACSNTEVVESCSVIILATRPLDAMEALRSLPWSRDHTLISVVSGARIAALAGVAQPATVVRAMPLSSAAIGESPTSLFPDNETARLLFAGVGDVHVLPTEEAFTAASTLGAFYGWVYALVKDVATWAESAGVPQDQARAIVAETVRGAGGMILREPEQGLTDMLARLTTRGGITEHGLKVLHRDHGIESWTDACGAVLRRLQDAGSPR